MSSLSATPRVFDADFAALLIQTKADVVTFDDGGNAHPIVAQYGLAHLDPNHRPAWPAGLGDAGPAIETFVANDSGATAMSDNQPFVDAWQPNVEWLHGAVVAALAEHDLALDGDAYITASQTPTSELEGLAHMDDDTLVPTENVGVVAIIGEHAGPRAATTGVTSPGLRPMSQIQFADATLDDFAAGRVAHDTCAANQVAIFPQFGQLHAGPSAAHVEELASLRQLLVLRAKVCRT